MSASARVSMPSAIRRIESPAAIGKGMNDLLAGVGDVYSLHEGAVELKNFGTAFDESRQA
jgi:hypothetical protein